MSIGFANVVSAYTDQFKPVPGQQGAPAQKAGVIAKGAQEGTFKLFVKQSEVNAQSLLYVTKENLNEMKAASKAAGLSTELAVGDLVVPDAEGAANVYKTGGNGDSIDEATAFLVQLAEPNEVEFD